MTEPVAAFEQGPIRPPNEARSLLLRVTRNCPWNRCLFCPVYKGRRFSLRSVDDIKTDIRAARTISEDITALSWHLGDGGVVTDRVVRQVLEDAGTDHARRNVALWRYYGTGACFLQDADNLIMKTEDLVAVLEYLRKTFPEIRRVTTYARSQTVTRKSAASLKKIRKAGLDRIHIGLESGSDAVLKLMQKGVSAARHIEAGKKAIEAGLALSEYVMPGLGGQDLWRPHAEETARVLNAINPHFIRLRSLRVPRRVPLHELRTDGRFAMQSDDDLVREIRHFIERLDGITSTVTSDHMMNLVEDVAGTLPEDKPMMLAALQAYQDLTPRDRWIYRVGRRGGAYRGVADLRADPATYRKIAALVDRIEAENGSDGIETFIAELVDPYV